jgi:hypothetical protein
MPCYHHSCFPANGSEARVLPVKFLLANAKSFERRARKRKRVRQSVHQHANNRPDLLTWQYIYIHTSHSYCKLPEYDEHDSMRTSDFENKKQAVSLETRRIGSIFRGSK